VKGVQTDLVARNNALDIDNCMFENMELGRSWREFGMFEVVFLFSLYHHIYNVAEDHLPIWYWLYKHTSGTLLWENPVDLSDGVAEKDIQARLHGGYSEAAIRAAAERYFDIEVVGPGHVASRVVWRCTPKKLPLLGLYATVKSGAGGASKAFDYANGRRIKEIETAIGVKCLPGSLNLRAEVPFDWSVGYYRAQILDVADRQAGLASKWVPRWCRFYPIDQVNDRIGASVYAMRFEGDRYADTLVELISDEHLRSVYGVNNGDTLALYR
jgi:hypothetical protein